MATNEENVKQDLNALVTQCVGADRTKQEVYLVRVIMKLLIERYGRGPYFSDSNVIQVHKLLTSEDFDLAMKMLDVVYASAAKELLDVPCRDMLGVRSEVIKYMWADLERRQGIKCEAGI